MADAAGTGWARNTGPRSAGVFPYAKALFDKVMNYKYETITVEEVQADHALQILREFTTNMGSNPPSSSNRAPLTHSTLKKYVEALAHDMRTRFGNDPRLHGTNFLPPIDIGTLTSDLQKELLLHAASGDQEPELNTKVFPIPRKVGSSTRALPFDDHGRPHPMEMARDVDWYTMARKLFRTCQFAALAKLGFTYNGIGRGGEVKFLTYDKMYFSPKFQMLFTSWFQRKLLKSNPTGFTSDWEYPECCNLFQLGCYWSLSNGLFRAEHMISDRNSAAYRMAKFVFQDLHNIADGAVAKQVTTHVRALVPEQVKDKYSAKSMRGGSISEIAWNPAVTYEEATALGGWTTGANRDYYVWVYLIAVVPPAMALAGYPNPRCLPSLPRLDILFFDEDPTMRLNGEQTDRLFNNLFIISLPDFHGPHGKLRPLLRVVTAIMIRNFTHCQDVCGNDHQFVMKMMEAVVSAEIATNRPSASTLLRHWSKKLVDHTKENNPNQRGLNDREANPILGATLESKIDTVNNNHAQIVREQRTTAQRLSLQDVRLQQLTTEVRNLRAQQDQQQQTNQQLLQMVQQLIDRPQNSAAIPGTPRPPPPPPNTEAAQTVTPAAHPNVPAAAAATQPVAASVAAAAPQPVARLLPANNNPVARLPPANNNRGAALAPFRAAVNALALVRTGSGNKGARDDSQMVKYVLLELYKNNNFQSLRASPQLDNLSQLVLMRHYGGNDRNKNKVKTALKIIDALWSRETRQKSIDRTFRDNKEALNAYLTVDKAVIKFCHWVKNPNPSREKPAGQRSSHLLGVANTVQSAKFVLEPWAPDWRQGGDCEKLQLWIESRVNAYRGGGNTI